MEITFIGSSSRMNVSDVSFKFSRSEETFIAIIIQTFMSFNSDMKSLFMSI